VISQSATDKQREILNAALKLFVEHGFHATPTSKIAKEAGVANGTLFHYYKTKDELIVALYVDIKTRLSACMKTGENGYLPIKEKCREFFIGALNWGMQNMTEFRFVQQFMSSPYLLMLAPEEIQKQSRLAMDLINEGIKAKVLRKMPVEFIHTLLSSQLFGINQYLMTVKPTPAAQKKLIEESFEMVWGMISV
jgi:AcrR family transcriptional regulator